MAAIAQDFCRKPVSSAYRVCHYRVIAVKHFEGVMLYATILGDKGAMEDH